MKSNIDDLCDAFIAAITDVGYAPKNIENYKQVSNRFKKFCAENDYDTYTANIGQMFADNIKFSKLLSCFYCDMLGSIRNTRMT